MTAMYMGAGAVLLHGTVAEFDDHAGTGTITAADGTAYPFHCIEIADGTRSIELNTPVEFTLLARFGRYQAAQLRHS